MASRGRESAETALGARTRAAARTAAGNEGSRDLRRTIAK
jgi:hypothetical protein